MRDVRAQFFLTFAVLGTVLPYAPVFFRDRGLTHADIGLAFAIWSGLQIATPALIAWAADARHDPRRLVVLCSAVTGGSLLALGLVRGVGPLLAVWTLYCAASVPMLPLMDGIYFSLRRRDADLGRPVGRPYHRVRVWGTVGYIVPSVALYWLLDAGMNVAVAPMSGAVFAALAAAQGLLLPDPRLPVTPVPEAGRAGSGVRPPNLPPQSSQPPARPGPGLPTAAAAGTLLRPPLLAFCLALLLAQAAGAGMATFYPVYLTEQAGVATKWVGLIAQVGVVVEMFFVFGCGWLVARLGVKGVLIAGLAATAARLGLLAASTAMAVAIGTQLFHGIYLVMTGVVPQTFLDRHAKDDYRHSVQGVFVMLMGCGKVLGNLAGGAVAAVSVQAVFGWGAALCTATCLFVLLTFRESSHRSI
jgi:PPP family 3-phenylpropionic acid transporter